MSFDWQHFKDIVHIEGSYDYRLKRKIQLETVIAETDFIIDFLTQLANGLKQLGTAADCVHQYPQAGTMLTMAAKHPFINYTPVIARLLLTCILEYSKLDLTSDLDQHSKSTIWCINRLRRVSNHIMTDAEGVAYHHIPIAMDKCMNEMMKHMKNTKMSSKRVMQMTEYCIALAPEESATELIEEVVGYALPISQHHDPMHYDMPQPLLSEKFVYQVMNTEEGSTMTLRNHYQQWSYESKIKLLVCYDEVLEMEVLNMIEAYLRQSQYRHLESIQKVLSECDLYQVFSSSLLKERVFYHLSYYIRAFHNWELVRLNTCLQSIIRTFLNEQCHAILNIYDKDVSGCACALYGRMREYVFTGSNEEISTRRYHVWLVFLSMNRYIWKCTYTLMEWCNGNDPWVIQMEHILNLFNFIIYPSLDHREHQSLSDLRAWLRSCQGSMNQSQYTIWADLFNHNCTVIASFMLYLILSHSDQIGWIDKVLFRTDLLPSQRKLDIGIIHALLDYLYDIKHYPHYYHPYVITHVDTLIEHVLSSLHSN